MKQLPNIISLLRMVFSIGLLGLEPFSPVFYGVYSLCGLSDMLDGYIARKIDAASKLGSQLDSASDLIFLGVVFWLILPRLVLSKGLIFWIIAIAAMRFITVGIGFKKRHTLEIAHTYGNKLTGLLLFLSVFALPYINIQTLGAFLCGVASLSALEELIIQLKGSGVFRKG